MIWVTNTNLPGGDVGMTPFTVGLVLVIQLPIGILLALLFNKILRERIQKIIGLTLYIILYELIFVINDGQFSIINSFNGDWSGEIYAAYSLSSIIGYIMGVALILIKEPKKIIAQEII
ncbi:hypothetical protein [Catalinimonas niigatensis]|uniref:hypothetical protein n=1 Tax=Catalinimonas niigatensis TaxID=1397264 RepID=UPI002665121E|nr:hypothetical protein [Catalinimonas niigatensis]WPP49669.1 hypothetical protein PZB72_23625 [Catalinimonas niigatensis]